MLVRYALFRSRKAEIPSRHISRNSSNPSIQQKSKKLVEQEFRKWEELRLRHEHTQLQEAQRTIRQINLASGFTGRPFSSQQSTCFKPGKKNSDHSRRSYSTGRPPNEKSSYAKFIQGMKSEPPENVKNAMAALLLAGLVGLLLYQIYKDNVQTPLIDKSVLRDAEYEDKDVDVIDAMTLKSVDHHVTSGRSHGYKVSHAHEDEEHRFYYYKEPFSREGYLNELVLGGLLRQILGEAFPRIMAVETPVNDLEDDSRYGLISESLNEKKGNLNLEEWATLYVQGEITDIPEHLGISVAADMLFGKTDSKLANLVFMRKHAGDCYSIDHESGCALRAQFLTQPNEGLAFIGEFRKKTLSEHVFEQQADGVVDTAADNRHQPLKGNDEVKRIIAPVLIKAINNDIENRSVIAFYEKFAALSEADIKKVFARYGSLIHADEQERYLKDIQARQEETRKFLREYTIANLLKDAREQNDRPSATSRFGK